MIGFLDVSQSVDSGTPDQQNILDLKTKKKVSGQPEATFRLHTFYGECI